MSVSPYGREESEGSLSSGFSLVTTVNVSVLEHESELVTSYSTSNLSLVVLSPREERAYSQISVCWFSLSFVVFVILSFTLLTPPLTM